MKSDGITIDCETTDGDRWYTGTLNTGTYWQENGALAHLDMWVSAGDTVTLTIPQVTALRDHLTELLEGKTDDA